MKPWIDKKYSQLKEKINMPGMGVQMMIAASFTVVACITIILLSLILYNLFSDRVIRSKTESAEQFLNQTKRSMEDYLRGNRRVSDALYYSCIKNTDLESDSLDESLNLVYETNKDNVVGIALYTGDGILVSSVPVAGKKQPGEIITQDWFTNAFREVENLHFSMPHVQNLSDELPEGYHWVISLSRVVELNVNGAPGQGVLLVDIKYSSIRQILEKVNSDNTSEYIYLCDGEGNIIYHPQQELMNAGLYEEATTDIAFLTDGSYNRRMQGEDCIIVTKTISYTGWKLVSVISKNSYNLGLYRMRYLLVFFISITILGILLINQQVSRTITKPLIKLDRSIRDIENGNLDPDIYIGGPTEVEHLGRTFQSSVQRIRQLMDEVLEEQELKRRSELDALQSQINPHFLYNTLDSVMWMIEDEQNDGAVYMIKELAKLLRISISRGRTIIPVRDEILHARSYMNIQKIRYKNQFTCSFDIDDSIMECATIKLIIQPLLENAIYHGVQGMDEDGEILVRGTREGDRIYLDVIDNGYGMTAEQIEKLSSGNKKQEDSSAGKGNGVGLRNVDTRIRMRFGEGFGLQIESERGEGTRMRLVLPFVEYTPDIEEKMNRKQHSTK
ncbi:MAG: sensor histidine kinase [Lachnospiraceae bacterium]|nr:sensor histidine kinase [Lachnospiraceae bacterium]